MDARSTRNHKNYRWHFREPSPDRARLLEAKLKVNPAVARLLANRGYCDDSADLEEFINPTLSSLYDPFLMQDMDVAVDRVLRANRDGEAITVYGDYDTDGATSTALLLRTFQYLSINADYYIPHRIEEGYGMNCASLDGLAKNGTRLIITVDNGICCVEEVARATELGIDVVVTDHHQPGAELPKAVAVVNPNRGDCLYPNKYLAGVGVAFKFAHALLKRMRVPSDKAVPFLRSMLDLVALGTIADFAPMSGENRVLVRHGLEQIIKSSNVGINELRRLVQTNGNRITSQVIGFQMAPRLNAAGRTNSARHCVELLTTRDLRVASDIVSQLEMFNRERRNVESSIFEECLRFVETSCDLSRERILVVSGADWHIGVIGIVASKLMERFDRPVIVLSEADGFAKGSARSIKKFNIHDTLTACRDHLITFGGHPNAAGLKLRTGDLPVFRRTINEYACEVLGEADLLPSITIDTEIHGSELDFALLQDLQVLEPHGPANPYPVFSVKGLKLTRPARIVGNNHLRLSVSADGRAFDAIGFNLGDYARDLSSSRDVRLDVAFCPLLNTFASRRAVELEIRDLKIQPA